MGDIVKRKTTAEKIADRENRKKATVHTENNTVSKMSKGTKTKDRPISARVNGVTYLQFRAICEARGITANACLNMLITDYVRENKGILEQ